ncbi:MAG: MEKHLA domain-containing protein, partial [Endozoicomonas sp.]
TQIFMLITGVRKHDWYYTKTGEKPLNVPSLLDETFYLNHGALLCQSFQALTGRNLVTSEGHPSTIHALFDAPFALVSHGTETDPVFNFANRTALSLFEFSWKDFICLPSRCSAEPVHQEERERLLKEVTEQGYIRNYSGIRVASSGQRFRIEKALVWNLIDPEGHYHGQAALFDHWTFL